MYKLCVFAGTTEGRELVEFLSKQPVEVTACVATEYGETLLPIAENLTVSAKRLPVAEITLLLSKTAYDLVIDATHPYAASITESIAAACQTTGTEYLRILRGASALPDDVVYVPDPETAAEFLDGTEGTILLTTGSKELAKYGKLTGFGDRVYARVLPLGTSLDACRAAGLKASHIIAMQGPFSEEMNLAMLRAVSASWLVTKDGGEPGGFEAKLSAAQKANARLVVIGRPAQKDGVSFSAAMEQLCTRFGCSRNPHVDILGIGPGNREAMTEEARQAIKRADCLIGAKRMLEAVASPGQRVHDAVASGEIADFILTRHEYQRFAVLMSGDVGFFSGTKKLLPLLDSCEVKVLPGLSSLVYLCARLKTSYEDIFVTSAHGRQHNIVPDVRAHERVFVLAGGENGIGELCRSLVDAGLGNVQVSVGERLSYPDEKITQDTAEHLADGAYEALSVALIENSSPDAICFFPAVGLFCGAVLWGWLALAEFLELGSFFFAVIASCLPLLITGGIHMDGYMDTVDALASHQSRERKLEILKDPHCGAFAVIYCGVYLLIYAGLMHELFTANCIPVICPTFVLSRALSALCAVNMPNARNAGMLCAYTENTEKRAATIALTVVLLISGAALVLLSPVIGGTTLLFAIVSTIFYRRLAMKQFGGVTGDTSGFFLQICELACLFGAWIGVCFL